MSKPRKRARMAHGRRDRKEGKWLTPLECSRCRVWRDGLFGIIKKDGWELTGTLAYLDYRNHLWIQFAGYIWDGSSYPDFIEPVIGSRNLHALLAASAHHDDMGPDTLLYVVRPEQYDYLRVILAHRNEALTLEGLNDLRQIRKNVSILEGAKTYRRMIRDWPDPEQSISRIRRLLQSLGLVLFQRKFRLLSGGSNEKWKKVES